MTSAVGQASQRPHVQRGYQSPVKEYAENSWPRRTPRLAYKLLLFFPAGSASSASCELCCAGACDAISVGEGMRTRKAGGFIFADTRASPLPSGRRGRQQVSGDGFHSTEAGTTGWLP